MESSAQYVITDNPQSPLWIVDGYALRDSAFLYSIPKLQSDSASILVARSLSHVDVSDIKSILCDLDSVPTVNITTDKRIPLFFVINGTPHDTDTMLPVGRVLSRNDWIQEIVDSEFPYIEESGIKDIRVLQERHKQVIFDYTPQGMVLIITTRRPYNKVTAMLKHAMPNPNIKPHKSKGGER